MLARVSGVVGKRNLFLSQLPAPVFDSLLPHLQLIEVTQTVRARHVMGDEFVCFPVSCVFAAMSSIVRKCSCFQMFVSSVSPVGLIWAEFLPGIHHEFRVVKSGYLLRGSYEVFWELLGRAHLVENVVARTVSSIARIATVNSECAVRHNASARLARIILEAQEAVGSHDDLTLSQAEWASLIGTRREAVAGILRDWTSAGVVSASRSRIRVVVPQRLRQLSCACYGVVQPASLTAWKPAQKTADVLL
jgi:hypothetical protein